MHSDHEVHGRSVAALCRSDRQQLLEIPGRYEQPQHSRGCSRSGADQDDAIQTAQSLACCSHNVGCMIPPLCLQHFALDACSHIASRPGHDICTWCKRSYAVSIKCWEWLNRQTSHSGFTKLSDTFRSTCMLEDGGSCVGPGLPRFPGAAVGVDQHQQLARPVW